MPGHTIQHCAQHCGQLESCTLCPPLKLLRATLRVTVAEVESAPTSATSHANVSPYVHFCNIACNFVTPCLFWLRKNLGVQGCVTFASKFAHNVAQCGYLGPKSCTQCCAQSCIVCPRLKTSDRAQDEMADLMSLKGFLKIE